MQLAVYLEARAERPIEFARRAGLPATTVYGILAEGRLPRADIANAIIRASRQEPAPDGGTVTLEDLANPEQAA